MHFHDKQSENVSGFCVKEKLQEIGTYRYNFQVSGKPKTGKTPEYILKIHQHVWGNMQPKEISRMIL